MTDRLEETLRTLQLDVDRVGLADSASVRDRGDRRTRHQVVGSALATVALVAAAVGVTGTLTADREAVEGPPANPTVSTTQEPVLSLAAQPLLRDGDLTGIEPYGAFQDSGEQPSYQLLQCIDVPALAGDAKRMSTVLFEPDIGEPTVHEHALQFESARAAERFVVGLVDRFDSCPQGDPAEVTTEDRPDDGSLGPVADGAYRFSRLSTPTANAGIGYYELGTVRESNLVVVLEWSSMGLPDGVDWVWTEQRLQTAIDRAAG